uniref:Uncharacterized protein n=1 Tax=viral metagenome TaxID=1070528 RepID=A0A6M3KAH4_9ZZZZ
MSPKAKRRMLKSLLISVYEEGEPEFEFDGVWSTALLERMSFKARKALRGVKVRAAQAAKEALTSDNMKEEESDGGRT